MSNDEITTASPNSSSRWPRWWQTAVRFVEALDYDEHAAVANELQLLRHKVAMLEAQLETLGDGQ